MVVKKFYGTSTREALRQVRDELGPDALILSNRQVAGGGIEIMAVADTDVAALTAVQTVTSGARPNPPRSTVQPQAVVTPEPQKPVNRNLQKTYALPPEEDDDDEPSLPPVSPKAQPLQQRNNAEPPLWRPSKDVFSDYPAENERPLSPVPQQPIPSLALDARPEKPAPAKTPATSDTPEGIEDMVREMKFLRSLLEGQLAGMAWGDMQRNAPDRVELMRQLLAVGLSPSLSRHLVDNLPKGTKGEAAIRWAKTALLHNLPLIGTGEEVIDRGGVYALVGPTGVGKTTTVAKLAARATLKYGPDKVALLTTDTYRIGAHDQLKIYGKILNVPVHAVKDEADLQLTLADLADRHIILIDTVGMSQRDKRVAEQVALLSGVGQKVERLLLLSANAQGPMLDDVVKRYIGEGLTGCIFTKLDEAPTIGSGLDVIIRHRLPLHYVTNGQRVPEDLHLANGLYLVDRAFKLGEAAQAYRLQDEEYPLYVGARPDDGPAVNLQFGARRG